MDQKEYALKFLNEIAPWDDEVTLQVALEQEIKDLRVEMVNMDNRHRENENNLFEKCARMGEKVAFMEGKDDKG